MFDIEKERIDFERWARGREWHLGRYDERSLGAYTENYVESAWLAWKARAGSTGY